jgi:hypothetical protein
VQVIYNPPEAHALVTGKGTVFEVVINSNFTGAKTVTVNVTLTGWDTAVISQDFVLNPGPDNNIIFLPRESTVKPMEVVGRVSYSVYVDPLDKHKEADETNNSIVDRFSTVIDTKPLRILFVPVANRTHPHVHISDADLNGVMQYSKRFLLGTYPIADNELTVLPWPLGANDPFVLIGPFNTDLLRPAYAAVDRLTSLRNVPYFDPIAGKITTFIADRVVGIVPVDWLRENGRSVFDPFELRGITYCNAKAVVVETDLSPGSLRGVRAATAVAHEIGHTYGLSDDYPSARATECDRNNREVDSRGDGYWPLGRFPFNDEFNQVKNLLTFMNEVGSSTSDDKGDGRWVSDKDYQVLIDKLEVGDPEILTVNGVLFRNGTALFGGSWFRVAEGQEDLSEGTFGNYFILLLDSAENTLSKMGFNATFGLTDPAEEVDDEPFSYRIRWVDGTNSIQLQDSFGNVLANRIVSMSSPSVTLLSPNGGEIIKAGKNHTISWTASDPDGDFLTYALLISNDNGQIWLPLATDLEQGNLTRVFSVPPLPPGKEYLIAVIASDGVNSVGDSSDSVFTVIGPKGDVDGDGDIDVFDMITTGRIVVGELQPDTLQREAADVEPAKAPEDLTCGNGSIDVFDMITQGQAIVSPLGPMLFLEERC